MALTRLASHSARAARFSGSTCGDTAEKKCYRLLNHFTVAFPGVCPATLHQLLPRRGKFTSPLVKRGFIAVIGDVRVIIFSD
ncbi:hypothetical protein O5624_02350 [Escherichia coli]|nr:hypothetical protein [Escherichia coli]